MLFLEILFIVFVLVNGGLLGYTAHIWFDMNNRDRKNDAKLSKLVSVEETNWAFGDGAGFDAF